MTIELIEEQCIREVQYRRDKYGTTCTLYLEFQVGLQVELLRKRQAIFELCKKLYPMQLLVCRNQALSLVTTGKRRG